MKIARMTLFVGEVGRALKADVRPWSSDM